MSIATLAQLKASLDLTGTTDDALLQDILDRISDRVEEYTGREFSPDPPLDAGGTDTLDPVQRVVALPTLPSDWPHAPFWVEPATWRRPRRLNIPDVREIVTVTFQGVSVDAWEPIGKPPYRRLKLFGAELGATAISATPTVTITGRFGIWPAPGDLVDAVLIMTSRRYRERDASYGDQVVMPDASIVNYFKQFSPSVQATLEDYRRRGRLR